MIALILFNWIVVIAGFFLIYQILGYLKNKPPGHFTILDGIYAQLLTYYAITLIPVWGISTLRYLFGPLPWILAFVFGFSTYTLTTLFSLYLSSSAIIRFLVVFYPYIFENINDGKILHRFRIINWSISMFIDFGLMFFRVYPGSVILLYTPNSDWSESVQNLMPGLIKTANLLFALSIQFFSRSAICLKYGISRHESQEVISTVTISLIGFNNIFFVSLGAIGKYILKILYYILSWFYKHGGGKVPFFVEKKCLKSVNCN